MSSVVMVPKFLLWTNSGKKPQFWIRFQRVCVEVTNYWTSELVSQIIEWRVHCTLASWVSVGGSTRHVEYIGLRLLNSSVVTLIARAFQSGPKSFDSIWFDSRYRIDFFDSIWFANLINLPLLHWYSNSNDGESVYAVVHSVPYQYQLDNFRQVKNV